MAEISEAQKKELVAILNVPAVYVNRVYISLLEEGITKITFGEEQPDIKQTKIASSITVSDQTLVNLRGIIDMIIQHKNKLVQENNDADQALLDVNAIAN